MVAVEMREQNGVQVAQRLGRRRRHATAQVRHPVAQQRVGEQAHAVEIDQNGAVPDPRHAGHWRRVCCAARHRAGNPTGASTR